MSVEAIQLPSNVEEISALIYQQTTENERLTRENQRQQARIDALQE